MLADAIPALHGEETLAHIAGGLLFLALTAILAKYAKRDV